MCFASADGRLFDFLSVWEDIAMNTNRRAASKRGVFATVLALMLGGGWIPPSQALLGTPPPLTGSLVAAITSPSSGSTVTGTIPANASVSRTSPATSWAGEDGVYAAYGRLPLGFEPNRGQADKRVKFLAQGQGYGLFLTSTEAVLALNRAETEDRAVSAGEFGRSVLRMRFIGANPSAKIAGMDPLPGKVNYFIGNDPKRWHSNIPLYGRVKCHSVYPGVDLIYYGYGNQRQLEYDFIVAPGADPAVITLDFKGAKKMELGAEGDLLLHTASGTVRLREPVVYQEKEGVRKELAGRYVLKGGQRAGFKVAAYDRAQTLVIDPMLVYSTYLGGVRGDHGNAVAVDASGAAYIAGGFQYADNNDFDVFVAKFDPTGGTLLWYTRIGGQFNEEAEALALDSAGNVHITGWTGSSPSNPPGRPEYPRTPDALQPAYGGGLSDAFVTVLSPEGTLIYSTFFGGSGDDQGRGIALDAAGNAYLTGFTASPDFPTAAPFQPVSGGGYDAYVAVMNRNKSALLYSSYLGGTGDDRAFGLALDRRGHVYVVGTTGSSDFPTRGPFQVRFVGGATDAFVVKLRPAGAGLAYGSYLGGSGAEQGRGIAVDSAGQVYVTGTTDSPDFPTAHALEDALSAPPNADAFLAKFTPSGTGLVYSTYLGAKGGSGVAVDAGGSAYVTGGDVLYAKLDPDGSTLLDAFWARGGRAIALDGSGHAYVTGGTFSYLFPTKDAYQPRNGGQFSGRGRDDVVLAKISDAPAPPPAVEEDDPRASYTGTWSVDEAPGHSAGRAVFTDADAGGTVSFTFTGTGIQLIGRRDESSGYANVMLDSDLASWGAVDTYASPPQEQALILSVTGLASGTHTLTVAPVTSRNPRSRGSRVWVDGFTVIGAPTDTTPPQ